MNDEVHNLKVSIIDFSERELVGLDERDLKVLGIWFKHFTGWLDVSYNLEQSAAIKFITRVILEEEDIDEKELAKSVKPLDDVSFMIKNREGEELLISLLLNYDFENPSKIIIIKKHSVVEFLFYPPKKKKLSSKLNIRVNTQPLNKQFYLGAFKSYTSKDETIETDIDFLKKVQDILLEYKSDTLVQKIIEDNQIKSM